MSTVHASFINFVSHHDARGSNCLASERVDHSLLSGRPQKPNKLEKRLIPPFFLINLIFLLAFFLQNHTRRKSLKLHQIYRQVVLFRCRNE